MLGHTPEGPLPSTANAAPEAQPGNVVMAASPRLQAISLADDLDDLFNEMPQVDIEAAPVEGKPMGRPFEQVVFAPPALELGHGTTFTQVYSPKSLNHALPLANVDQVLNRQYAFADSATPATLAAIPPVIGSKQIQLTHLELRSVVANAIQSLGDMQPQDIEDGIEPIENKALPGLPSAPEVLARVEDVIREMRNQGYITPVPRTSPNLDLVDRAVRHAGFPNEWRDTFTANAPAAAYELTPEGRAAGELIRLRNDGPVVGVGGDESEVLLPDTLEKVAYAGAMAGHEILMDHYDAGLLGAGDIGRALAQESLDIRDSLMLPGNKNPDVVAGRVLENLDATIEAATYVVQQEEPEMSVAAMAIRPEEIRDVLKLSQDSIAMVPQLAVDPFVRERMTQASAVYEALSRLQTARDGFQQGADLTQAEAWKRPQSLADDIDLRPIAAISEAHQRFEEAGVRPDVADLSLVWSEDKQHLAGNLLKNWIPELDLERVDEVRAIDASFSSLWMYP